MRLEESLNDERWPGRGIELPVLSMAYQRAGRHDDAQAALMRSEQLLDRLINQSREQQGAAPIPWFDWIEFLANHREATARITGEPPRDDPRVIEARGLAQAAIR